MPKILIIDDKQHIRLPLAMMLTENGFEVEQAESVGQALLMQRKLRPDIILMNEVIQGVNTTETLSNLLDQDPRTSCILLTEHNVHPSSLETKRSGAFDYLLKPFDVDELLSVIKRALEVRRFALEVKIPRKGTAVGQEFKEIIGKSPALLAVFRTMSKVALANATLLIQGESGTGKELVVRAIHAHSHSKAGPFVAINCAAVPESLFEAEFFGHEKGAFTDARQMRTGHFEQAHRGTLFLDEIGELSLGAQVKLLRAIENQEVTRLGGKRPIKVSVRIVSATNIDLRKAVEQGEFRKDLYWRLNVVKIIMPNLRERREDLPLLIDHMLRRFNGELGLAPKTISLNARRLLETYDWPGNVRELEHAICSAIIVADDDLIHVTNLPLRIQGLEENWENGHEYPKIVPASGNGASLSEAIKNSVSKMEKQMISTRLYEMNNNRMATAESLGISRKSLFNKMRLYGLNGGPH